MKWAEVVIRCPAGTDEVVAAAVNPFAPMLSVMDAGTAVKLWLPVDDRIEPSLLGICDALDNISRDVIPDTPELTVTYVEDSKWSLSWREFFKGFDVAGTFRVRPPWETDGDQRLIPVIIDPGMAFGTGQHPTTLMLMEMLAAEPPKGLVVGDVGSGSGILAIAAARLGAAKVIATEIDPVASENGKRNIELNGLGSVVDYTVADGIAFVRPTFDLLLVNILAHVILGLASDIYAAAKPGGSVYCSGIIDDRVEDVTRRLTQVGFEQVEVRSSGEWRAVRCRKPA